MNWNLHTRISLVLTGLAATLLLALGGLWLAGARQSIHEEIEAATRVAGQWLDVVAGEAAADPSAWKVPRLLAHVRAVGRIRANALEVADAGGRLLYVSPPPAYKAGRAAPGWFAQIVEPAFAERRIDVGTLTLTLRPDASRSILDAWDDLCAMAGWAAMLLAALFFASRWALDRALRPLGQIMAALDRTGRGRFDTRLPVYAAPDLGRLARAFNGMADRLSEAVDENVRLGAERELDRRLQGHLADERKGIARELHDELSQGITAVRALAGAIAQRAEAQADLRRYANNIIDVTGEMQDGVRAILQRLRPPTAAGGDLERALGRHLEAWRQQHPQIAVRATLAVGDALLDGEAALALLRIVQEGLTNVARHAAASRVDIELRRPGAWLELMLADNGRGLGRSSPAAGCGLGLAGMRERVAALGGELAVDGDHGGVRLRARLPAPLHPT